MYLRSGPWLSSYGLDAWPTGVGGNLILQDNGNSSSTEALALDSWLKEPYLIDSEEAGIAAKIGLQSHQQRMDRHSVIRDGVLQ